MRRGRAYGFTWDLSHSARDEEDGARIKQARSAARCQAPRLLPTFASRVCYLLDTSIWYLNRYFPS
jgi:hypothetical protein